MAPQAWVHWTTPHTSAPRCSLTCCHCVFVSCCGMLCHGVSWCVMLFQLDDLILFEHSNSPNLELGRAMVEFIYGRHRLENKEIQFYWPCTEKSTRLVLIWLDQISLEYPDLANRLEPKKRRLWAEAVQSPKLSGIHSHQNLINSQPISTLSEILAGSTKLRHSKWYTALDRWSQMHDAKWKHMTYRDMACDMAGRHSLFFLQLKRCPRPSGLCSL